MKNRGPKLFSYVVDHDTGDAPNPFFGYCTLCVCKYRKSPDKPRNVVEMAQVGDWIVGTGGASLVRSAGNGKIVYTMKVTEKMTLSKYFNTAEFATKKPGPKGNHRFGDNLELRTHFEKYERFVLISDHFYYFGRNAIKIPKKFSDLEKKFRGFKSCFDGDYRQRFVNWIENEIGAKPGKHGDPCWPLSVHDDECAPCKPRSERTAPVCPVCD